MPSPSPPPDPGSPHPSADEAARALDDIGRRRNQAHGPADHARWVYVLAGVVFAALFAAPDFFGAAANG
ncbi:hypothetical protein [Streptomyces sp. NPDC045470]|uniref:hypothetical protein n=1 Tax=Streptomyces sp. NPDC045470 TaxID=3155469 RepID=UPI0033CBCFD0